MATIYKSGRSQAFNWFLHRITGTFLVFLLITHFWVQHFDYDTKVITEDVITDATGQPQYETGTAAAIDSYDRVMMRLAHPVYAVLWKGFNILFLVFALHHGTYGLNNVLGDYIRSAKWRVGVFTLTWTVSLILLIIGLYSVITAGAGYTGPVAIQ